MATELDLEWFPFYWRDFDEGTRELTNEEVGAYMRLLSYQWRMGSIPADRARAGRVTGEQISETAWEGLQRKFIAHEEPGRLVNARMREVRTEQARRHALRVAAGRAGGYAKASSNAPSNAPSNAASPTPSNAPTELRSKKEEVREEVTSPGAVTTPTTVVAQREKRAARARRCPKDFCVSASTVAWIAQEMKGTRPETAMAWATRELAKFKDHEFNNPRSDWEATFRNWLRRCVETGNVPTGARAGGEDERRRSQILQLAADLRISRRDDEPPEAFEKRVVDANDKRLAAARRGPPQGDK
jgi:uncharacterized protein YdaU (DUF1376 family)